MHDEKTRDRFIELRAQNWSFDRIARELNVAKTTLIIWSRRFQYDIQNLQAIHREALREKYLATEETRLQAISKQLEQVETEMAKRDLSTLPTWRLHTLAAQLRREAAREQEPVKFTVPDHEIPHNEHIESTHAWQA